MNIVKCKNNHFYDRDIYPKCPHCGEEGLAGEAEQDKSETKPKRKKFGKKKEDKSLVRVEEYPRKSEEQAPVVSAEQKEQDDDRTVPMDFGQVNKPYVNNDGDSATMDYWSLSTSQSKEVNAEETGSGAPGGVNPAGRGDSQRYVDPASYAEVPRVEKAESEQSLSNAIKKASASSAGKTMSYFSVMSSSASSESGSSAPQAVSTEPVVGWLVCVGGKHFGQSFNIATGKNSIGRDESNKIILPLDNSVSRSKHALITYEPKKRNFYLQPGESSGLTYLNDEYIDESKVLKAKDIIELGESKFIFIPLCDESFTWEDYIKR